MNLPFDITKEEVLNIAAQKIVDAYADESELHDMAESQIKERTKAVFETELRRRIDGFLQEEMQKLLVAQISPVDIWGERTGKPTTIREQLAERAKVFWELKVDNEGRESAYSGKPRFQWMFEQIVKDEFAAAVKANVDSIVAGFKAALKADAVKLTAEHIDKLIASPR